MGLVETLRAPAKTYEKSVWELCELDEEGLVGGKLPPAADSVLFVTFWMLKVLMMRISKAITILASN